MKKITFGILFFVLNLSLFGIVPKPSPSFTNVYENALRSVVFIAAEKNSFDLSYGTDPNSYYQYLRPFYEMFWPPKHGHGSGFIISEDGHIVTNMHVINEASSVLVAVQNPDLKIYKATVVGSDPRSDIAILKIENNDGALFSSLKFGSSNQARIGEQVMAIGNPLNTELFSTATLGIISAKERNNFCMEAIEGYIQTDASVNNGNSGGPLLNLNGEVIGVITWCYSHYFGREGLAFAVPSHTVKHVADQIISNGKVSQGYLGVELIQNVESAFDFFDFDCTDGAFIKHVVKGSPAEKAGLEAGDIIIEVNQYPIISAQSLRNQIWVLEPKTGIQLKVDRDERIIEMFIELGESNPSTLSQSKLVI